MTTAVVSPFFDFEVMNKVPPATFLSAPCEAMSAGRCGGMTGLHARGPPACACGGFCVCFASLRLLRLSPNVDVVVLYVELAVTSL